MNCSACHNQVPEGSSFCSNCGAELLPKVTAATLPDNQPDDASTSPKPPTQLNPSGESVGLSHFLPGTILADRYRIVGLLGRGGMGEVHRADDLKLGQAVALKFLPPHFSGDTRRVEFFRNEVRLARLVSHPNVCRVYDIGEVHGRHFLSMEFVDGEDLATLIRRIGRLPPDKGLDIARQLCAGLAAAHDRGVLHRDLKPSNVMLDGHGRIRITDFGLARLASQAEETGLRVGTPAYMAPEQLAGRESTARSDVYALGLLLYEVFTGRPPFKREALPDWTQSSKTTPPPPPSSVVEDIDPAIERVILQCLEEDPDDRPLSALAVAAELPGGDPLAAALAAGDTPSPEMVAAASVSGRLSRGVALGWLVALLLGLPLVSFLADKATVVGNAGLSQKPDALEMVARRIIEQLGYTTSPKDWAYGFAFESDYLWSLRARSVRDQRARSPAMHFWYRQSPDYLLPVEHLAWMVSAEDPPPVQQGMVGVRLGPQGNLIEFSAVPSMDSWQAKETETITWKRLFELAGLDWHQFRERSDGDVERRTPAFVDRWIVWEQIDPRGSTPIQVAAGACRGRPAYFRILSPYPQVERSPAGVLPTDRQPMKTEGARSLEWATVVAVFVVAGALARRSLRLGRSDRRGALRLGWIVFTINMSVWLLEASHVPHFAGEIALICAGLHNAVFFSVYMGLMYLTFEPYIRRFWPTLLISWNRLLAGRVRDPSVGRDLLVGAVVGIYCWPVLEFVAVLAPDWIGPVQPLWRTVPNTLLGGRHLFAVAIFCLTSIGVGLLFLLVLLLLRIVLQQCWLWALGFVCFGMMVAIGADYESPVRWLTLAVMFTALLLLYTRLGLLAGIAFFLTSYLLTDFPITADLQARYWGSSLFAICLVAAVGVYGFAISTRGRPAVQD